MGDNWFALPLSAVRETVTSPHMTPVPRMPAHLCGVSNLRGRIISMVDLRRFSFPPETAPETMTSPSPAIISRLKPVDSTAAELNIGFLVDHVYEVIRFPVDQILPAPLFGIPVIMDFVHGIFDPGLTEPRGGITILLDPDRILSALLSEVRPLSSGEKGGGG